MPDWMNPPGTFWPVPPAPRPTASESQEEAVVTHDNADYVKCPECGESDHRGLVMLPRFDWPEADVCGSSWHDEPDKARPSFYLLRNWLNGGRRNAR